MLHLIFFLQLHLVLFLQLFSIASFIQLHLVFNRVSSSIASQLQLPSSSQLHLSFNRILSSIASPLQQHLIFNRISSSIASHLQSHLSSIASQLQSHLIFNRISSTIASYHPQMHLFCIRIYSSIASHCSVFGITHQLAPSSIQRPPHDTKPTVRPVQSRCSERGGFSIASFSCLQSHHFFNRNFLQYHLSFCLQSHLFLTPPPTSNTRASTFWTIIFLGDSDINIY